MKKFALLAFIMLFAQSAIVVANAPAAPATDGLRFRIAVTKFENHAN